MFTSDNDSILLFDYICATPKDIMRVLRSVGIQTVLKVAEWDKIELTRGKYHWDELDSYLSDCTSVGMKVLLMVARAAPLFLPDEWFVQNKYDNAKYDTIDSGRRILSYWNEEAQDYRNDFVIKVCERYSSESVLCIPCIGDGESPYPVNGMNSGRAGLPSSLYCFDESAIQNFQTTMKSKYPNLETYNFHNETKFNNWSDVRPSDLCDSTLGWTDTLMWYNKTTYTHTRKQVDLILSYCKQDSKETWLLTYTSHKREHWWMNTGNYFSDNFLSDFNKELKESNTTLNIIWAEIYGYDPIDFRSENQWLQRNNDLNVWVGAQGANGILENSTRAARSGFKGNVVGVGFVPYATNKKTLVEMQKEIEVIAVAAQKWHIYKKRYPTLLGLKSDNTEE